MPYELGAVVGDFDRLRSWAEKVPGAVVAPLLQRMGLLIPPTAPFDELPQTLRDLSRTGPVAHVEADFWGGDGYQTAEFWRAGVREWGPETTSEFGGPREDWPINSALARLGVAPAGHVRAAARGSLAETFHTSARYSVRPLPPVFYVAVMRR